eukprot:2671317-Rhodomonas_salina.1
MGDNLPAVRLGTGLSAVSVSAGGDHSCAVLSDGSAKCWGAGSSGKLGQDSVDDVGKSSANEVENLNPINLGTGRTVLSLALGNGHSCALLDNNDMKCWGRNSLGQLGLGDTVHRGSNGIGSGMSTVLPVDLGSGRHAVSICANDRQTCAVLDDSSAKCWGYDNWEQLGQGDNSENIGDEASEMGNFLPAIQLGTGYTNTVADFACGGQHNCALFNDGIVKCFGNGFNGQDGSGSTGSFTNMFEMGDNLPVVDLGGDVNECALGTHDCDVANAACTDSEGSFTCACNVGWTSSDQGVT